jgi:hypothetical protein
MLNQDRGNSKFSIVGQTGNMQNAQVDQKVLDKCPRLNKKRDYDMMRMYFKV